MRLISSFIAVIFIAFSGFAQDKYILPKVELKGIEKVVGLGELVELSVSRTDIPANLVSTNVVWRVYDVNQNKLTETKVRELKDSVIFASGIRPKQMFVMAVATHLYLNREADKVLDVGTKTQIITGYLSIGDEPVDPSPTPPPPPPSLPDGRFKLAVLSFSEASKIKVDLARKASADVASAYRGVAAAIRAGAINNTEDVLKKAKESANAALTNNNVDIKLWDGVGVALQDKLYNLYKDGKIKLMGDYADAFEEIATGLEAVK